MIIESCPVCASNNYDSLYPEYKGKAISSDLKVMPNATLDNRLCKDCGLIFNAKGIRGFTKKFYKNSYKLMTSLEEGEIKSHTSSGAISQAKRTYEIFKESCNITPESKLLEVGAGKGDFLGHLLQEYADLTIEAFEPSESFNILKERFHAVKALNCDYTEYPIRSEDYEFIVSLGVLEHVEDPFDMLNWIYIALKPGGICFIRIPLFENNPNDIFTIDHLSKLTKPTIKYLTEKVGFSILSFQSKGVAAFVTLKKEKQKAFDIQNPYKENLFIANNNIQFAKGIIESVHKAREAAKLDGSNFGIFGMATSGLFAPFYLHFSTDEIAAYIDENSSMWNSKILDRPIGGLDLIKQMDIKHVALVISPVYHQQVKAKLSAYGVTVYSP